MRVKLYHSHPLILRSCPVPQTQGAAFRPRGCSARPRPMRRDHPTPLSRATIRLRPAEFGPQSIWDQTVSARLHCGLNPVTARPLLKPPRARRCYRRGRFSPAGARGRGRRDGAPAPIYSGAPHARAGEAQTYVHYGVVPPGHPTRARARRLVAQSGRCSGRAPHARAGEA